MTLNIEHLVMYIVENANYQNRTDYHNNMRIDLRRDKSLAQS